MARREDIKWAFILATRNAKQKGVITTADFVRELALLNWEFSYKEANEWIEFYQAFWRDKSDHHGENKTYVLGSMGYTR